MTIREYSTSRGISYEAAAKQIRKYKKKELKSHLKYEGALTILDEYAIEFLDRHRAPRSVVVAAPTEETANEILRLHEKIENMSQEIITLQSQLLASKDEILKLSQEQTLKLEEKTKEIESKYKPTLFGLYRKTE